MFYSLPNLWGCNFFMLSSIKCHIYPLGPNEKTFLQTCAKLVQHTHCPPQVRHHISAVATAAATMLQNFPHRCYRFSTNQVKPLYIYGSSIVDSYPSLWFHFNTGLMKSQMTAKQAFPAKLTSLADIPSYIQKQTLHKLQKDLIFMIGIITTA